MVDNRSVAVFNVESYFMATFKPLQERDFVENCAKCVAGCFERTAIADLATSGAALGLGTTGRNSAAAKFL
jgi:hypothetical protein